MLYPLNGIYLPVYGIMLAYIAPFGACKLINGDLEDEFCFNSKEAVQLALSAYFWVILSFGFYVEKMQPLEAELTLNELRFDG